jgi:dockerin type I repeat protein
VADAAGNAMAADAAGEFFQLIGDVNRDRRVDGTDFAILAGNFGKTGMTYAQGDLNGDGRIDGSDFALLAGNFGKTVPAPAGVVVAAAPAPTAAASKPAPAPRRTMPAPVRVTKPVRHPTPASPAGLRV